MTRISRSTPCAQALSFPRALPSPLVKSRWAAPGVAPGHTRARVCADAPRRFARPRRADAPPSPCAVEVPQERAVRIERAMDKEKILELYLNEIFLGQNSYGVAAAAQT